MMATLKQRALHRARYYLDQVEIFVARMWLPVEELFRRRQWRKEGKDPDSAEFYLSQIAPDNLTRVMILTGNVGLLAVHFIPGGIGHSVAVRQMRAYCYFKWLPYDEWEAINQIFTMPQPGQALIDWFLDVEEIPRVRLPWLVGKNAELKQIVDHLLEIDFTKNSNTGGVQQ